MEEPAASPFDVLDDPMLICILERLPVPDLMRTRLSSKRLWRCSQADSIWQGHVQSRFGLRLQGCQEQVFKALQHSKARSALPFEAVFTDRGADLPWRDYWVGNMLQMTPRTLYSSQSSTKDAHALCLLTQLPFAPGSSKQPTQASTQGEPGAAQDALQAHRERLLRFCLNPAVYLLKPVALSGMLRGVLPRVTTEHLAAARQRLEECSTQGLEDFLIYAYGRMAHGEMWGRSLIKGINSTEDIHEVHEMAWRVWHGENPRQHVTIRAAGLPNDVTPSEVNNTEAAQQLVDVEALPRLKQLFRNQGPNPRASTLGAALPASPRTVHTPITLGVIREVMIDRSDRATCPISCGVVYAATFKPHTRSHNPVTSPTARKDSSAGCVRDGNGQETDWRQDLNNILEVTQHPWVTELSSATTAHQVMFSASMGNLPPLYGYYHGLQGEWLEFQQCTNSSSSTTTAPGDGDAAPSLPPHTCVTAMGIIELQPVVWFRFYDRQELAAIKRQRRQAAAQALQVSAERMVKFMIAQASEQVRSESESGAAGAGTSAGAASGEAAAAVGAPAGLPGAAGAGQAVVESGSGSGASNAPGAAGQQQPEQVQVQQEEQEEEEEGGMEVESVGQAEQEEDMHDGAGDEGMEVEEEEEEEGVADIPMSGLPTEKGGTHVFDLVGKWAHDNAPRNQGTLLPGLNDLGLPGADSTPAQGLPPGFMDALEVQLAELVIEARAKIDTAAASGSASMSDERVSVGEAMRRALAKDPLLAALLQTCAALDLPRPQPGAPGAELGLHGPLGGGSGQPSPRSPRLSAAARTSAGGSLSGSGLQERDKAQQEYLKARNALLGRASPEQLFFMSEMLNEMREAAVQDCEELGLRMDGWPTLDLKRPRWDEYMTGQYASRETAGRAALQQAWDWPSVKRRILAGTAADVPAGTAGEAAGGSGEAGAEGALPGQGDAAIVPVEVHRGMSEGADVSFYFSPPLALSAPEVSRLFGYGLGNNQQCHHHTTMHIRLHQQWAVNGMLVKMIASEDKDPEFNQGRGGCNMDVSYVACVGERVQLPASTYWQL